MNGLLRTLEEFDIGLFNSLIDEYLKESQKVKDKSIYLLIGPTGAGKSTTLHYLAGSTMKLEKITGVLNHITFDKLGPNVTNQNELKDVKISGEMISCTRFIKAIEFMEDGEKYTICDSPGVDDTRGPELDVANMYGVVMAARGCHNILPIIVLSQNGMGLRGSGLKKISKSISGFFKNIKQDVSSF